jgi:cell division protein FtsA
MKGHNNKIRTGLIAALDVGSTKLCCFVARANAADDIRVIGIGHQMSKGVRSGAVVDMDAAEISIRNAVHAAEEMAGETIETIVVNVSCGNPASRTIGVEAAINGYEIADDDIDRVWQQAYQHATSSDREILHMFSVGYVLDGARVADPRGMYGDRLGANMHVITANPSAIRNLESCIARCHLDIDTKVVSAYASGLSTLVRDETNLGVTLIDMGGGTTSIAVFSGGEAIYTDTIPIGGSHVTNDIARGLSTPLAAAERIKTLYGSASPSPSDTRESIDVPQIGENEPTQAHHVPKSILVGIIQPRLEETFELVRARLEASGFDRIAGRRVVLTGGASQLPGIGELATLVLDKQVRLGRPTRVAGIAEATGGPAFATCAGLLIHAVTNPDALADRLSVPVRNGSGLVGRLGLWLRDNF